MWIPYAGASIYILAKKAAGRRRADRLNPPEAEETMADAVFIAAILAFFALGALSIRACERI